MSSLSLAVNQFISHGDSIHGAEGVDFVALAKTSLLHLFLGLVLDSGALAEVGFLHGRSLVGRGLSSFGHRCNEGVREG